MPPQQQHRLLDVIGDSLNFRAHGRMLQNWINDNGRQDLVNYAAPRNRPE
jgi:hypothetical protein